MRHWRCSLVCTWLWKTGLNSDAVKNSSRPWRTSAVNFTHLVRHLEPSSQPFRNCVLRLQQPSSLRAAHIMLHFLRFHPFHLEHFRIALMYLGERVPGGATAGRVDPRPTGIRTGMEVELGSGPPKAGPMPCAGHMWEGSPRPTGGPAVGLSWTGALHRAGVYTAVGRSPARPLSEDLVHSAAPGWRPLRPTTGPMCRGSGSPTAAAYSLCSHPPTTGESATFQLREQVPCASFN